MPEKEYKDFTIRGVNHPKYNQYKIFEDDAMELIFQKLEMILFTNKGESISDPDMGCDIEYYLWQTTVPTQNIKDVIKNQIDLFITELNNMKYNITVDLYQGVYKDIGVINIQIQNFKIDFVFE